MNVIVITIVTIQMRFQRIIMRICSTMFKYRFQARRRRRNARSRRTIFQRQLFCRRIFSSRCLDHVFRRFSCASLTWRQRFRLVAILLQLWMSRSREFYWRLFSTLIFFTSISNSRTTKLSSAKWRIKNTRDFSQKKSLQNELEIWFIWKIKFNEIDSILILFQNDFETFSSRWRITISSTRNI